MNSDLNEKVTITLPKSDWLVVFELLASSYHEWRKENPNDSADAAMLISAKEFGERFALWHLEGAIESTLPEIFAGNYDELVERAKALLVASG